MNSDLMAFLVNYNMYRRHGSLRKELNVKTPFEAVQKWYLIMPELYGFERKCSRLCRFEGRDDAEHHRG